MKVQEYTPEIKHVNFAPEVKDKEELIGSFLNNKKGIDMSIIEELKLRRLNQLKVSENDDWNSILHMDLKF